jgi:MFS family permease
VVGSVGATATTSDAFRRRVTSDARRVLLARACRGFADGLASVVLPAYLGLLGLTAGRIGAIATFTLVGSAVATIAVAFMGVRWSRRHVLLGASLVMAGTGLGFAIVDTFWLLAVVALIGTLNPSSGDVSVFLPTEQSLLPQTVPDRDRTALFARYALAGSLLAAVGSLAAGVPQRLADSDVLSELDAMRWVFVAYGAVGLVTLVVYRGLTPAVEPPRVSRRGLGSSRQIVLRLSALFSLDAFAGGFTVQSMLALWLFLHFDLSIAVTGVVFFWTGLLTAASMLLSPVLASRVGLIRTMVFTHIPANVFLVSAALMPNATLAIVCLSLRSLLATMDVPARTSYVMAVVPPEHRAAAAAVTNVPRSLASSAGPVLAGAMLSRSTFGWPLIVAGSLKICYDLTLLRAFGSIRPPEEEQARD